LCLSPREYRVVFRFFQDVFSGILDTAFDVALHHQFFLVPEEVIWKAMQIFFSGIRLIRSTTLGTIFRLHTCVFFSASLWCCEPLDLC
jgi:hypothetical protein